MAALVTAGLSFLGLGTQPPHADWGRMVAEGAQVLVLGAVHIATIPALVIVVVALAAILAFIPLMHSVFWGTLAYTLIGGLLGGTI